MRILRFESNLRLTKNEGTQSRCAGAGIECLVKTLHGNENPKKIHNIENLKNEHKKMNNPWVVF